MLNDKNIKRPKSGKPPLLKPLTGITKKPLQNNNNQNKIYDNIFNKNITHKNLKKNSFVQNDNKIETKYTFNSNKTTEKTLFLKESYNTILSNQLNNFDNINGKKEKLKDINLIEKNYKDLYEWSNLLNNSRPISSYTTLNNKTFCMKNEDNKTSELSNKNKNVKKSIEHTIIECNDNKSKTNKSKSKHSNKRNINNSRPLSVYSHTCNSSSNVLSARISNYFKDNLKTFSDRIKVLKPKLRTNAYQLKKEIMTQRIKSAKKESELKRRLNSEEEDINIEKQKLIIAAERNNPIPLLQSIFTQVYPGKEVMKENIKHYFNTMKPFPSEAREMDDSSVDYTKNDKWRWIEEMKRNRLEKKLKFNKSDMSEYNQKNQKDLILSYYNHNDPYVQIFDRIKAQKMKQFNENNTNRTNNNLIQKNEIKEKCFNPILQNFDNNKNNFNPIKLKINENTNKNIINDEKKEDTNKNEINQNIQNMKNNQDLKNVRPKTGFKPNHITNNPWAKRPKTANRIQNNDLYTNIRKCNKETSIESNNYDTYSNIGFSSNNSLPNKTISNTGNVSYDKINEKNGIISKRKVNEFLLNDYFITSAGIINNNINNNNINNMKYNEEQIYLPKSINTKKNLSFNKTSNIKKKMKKNENNKLNGYYNNNKNDLNFYTFDDIIDSALKKNDKQDNMYSLNYFKNIGGKFYSSSNNVTVRKNRNNKYKQLHYYHTDSRYSKDEPETEFVDDGASSKTNSTFRKL